MDFDYFGNHNIKSESYIYSFLQTILFENILEIPSTHNLEVQYECNSLIDLNFDNFVMISPFDSSFPSVLM